MWSSWFGWELRRCGGSIECGEGGVGPGVRETRGGVLGGDGKRRPHPEKCRVQHPASLGRGIEIRRR
jgi:hypothetical protein